MHKNMWRTEYEKWKDNFCCLIKLTKTTQFHKVSGKEPEFVLNNSRCIDTYSPEPPVRCDVTTMPPTLNYSVAQKSHRLAKPLTYCQPTYSLFRAIQLNL